MSELLKKYESIDQSKLKEAFVKVLDRVKKLTNDFTTEDKKNNEIAEQVLDSVMQKNPDAIKIVKREPKAKPAPKKTHKATHTDKATPKATSAPVAKNSDNNIMTVAKQIQKAGESWKDAMERAKVVLKERKEKVVEKQKTELEKLYALVKTKKELQGFANSDIKRDAVREAKVKGARFVTKEGSTSNAYGTFPNKIGRKYWETRDRHADRLAPNYPKDMPLLASGGAVSDAPFSVEVFKTKLRFDNELTSSSKGDFSTFAKAKEFAIDMIDSGNYYAYINSKNGSNKYGLGNTEIFVQEENDMYCVYDNVYNDKSENWEIKKLADFDTMDEAKKFAIEHSKKEYANGGSLPFMTDPNFGDFQNTGSFELGGAFMMTDLAGNTGGGTGGLNADMPLNGFSGTNYTGLVGETGAMSSGELFMDGGAMMQNQQVINDASQPYVITEAFGNPAQHLAKGGKFKGFKFNVGDKVMVNTDLDFLNKFYHYEIPPTFEMGYDFSKPVTVVSVMVNSANKPFYGLRTAPTENSPKGYMVNSDLPEVLLSPATASNDDSDVKIRDWYMKNYPTDDLGEELNDEVTFEDMWNEDYKEYNIYQVMGVGDSVIRERLFEHLAEIKGVTYNEVYDKLFASDEYASGGSLGKALYVENSSWFVSNKYDEQKIMSVLEKIGAKKIHLENDRGWSNQPEVVVFNGDKNKAEDALNEAFDTEWIRVSEKDWRNRKMADGGSVDDSIIDELWNGYASALLFTETDSDSGEPLDSEYSISDFDKETVASSKKMLAEYYSKNKEAIEESELDLDTIGNDIWYTRSGQGAGFFDHSLDAEVEEKLTKGAKELGEYPSVETYDGKISVRGGKVFAKGGSLKSAKELSEDDRFELKVLQGLYGFNNGLNINGLYESIGFSNYRFNQYATESQAQKVKKALTSLIEKGFVEESGLGYKINQKGADYLREFNRYTFAKGGFLGTVEFNAGDTVWQKDEKRYATVMNNYGDPVNGDRGDIRLDTSGNTNIFTYDKKYNRTGYNLIKVGEKGDTGKFTPEVLADMKVSANRLIDSRRQSKDKNGVAYYQEVYKRLLDGEFDSMVGRAKANASNKKGSVDYTYVPNKDVKELSVVVKGELNKLMGSDILDGVYVKNSAKSTAKVDVNAVFAKILKDAKEAKVGKSKRFDASELKMLNLEMIQKLVEAGYTEQQIRNVIFGYTFDNKVLAEGEFDTQSGIFGYEDSYVPKKTDSLVEAKKNNEFAVGIEYPDFDWQGIIKKYKISSKPKELVIERRAGSWGHTEYFYEVFVGENIVIGHNYGYKDFDANGKLKNDYIDKTKKVTDPTKQNDWQKEREVKAGFNSGWWTVVSSKIEVIDDVIKTLVSQKGGYCKGLDFYDDSFPKNLKENNIDFELGGDFAPNVSDGTQFMSGVYAKGGSVSEDISECKKLVSAFCKEFGDKFGLNEEAILEKVKFRDYLGNGASVFVSLSVTSNVKDLKVGETRPTGGYIIFTSDINPNGVTGKDDIARTYSIDIEIKGSKRYTQRRTEEGRYFKSYNYGRTIEEAMDKTDTKIIYDLYPLEKKDDLKFKMSSLFADGGAMQGNNIDAELEDFDLDNLDPFETMQYNQFVKSSGKVGALQILINTVEGDYSQLSPELAELAEMQVSQEQWDEASRDIRFERDGYANGGVMANGGSLGYEVVIDGNWEETKKFSTFSLAKKWIFQNIKNHDSLELVDSYGDTIYVEGNATKEDLEWLFSNEEKNSFANGGGVSDYVNSPEYKALRDKFDKLHYDVKSRVVIAVGLDSAIEFYDADLTIAPYRFIERAVTGNFISLNEINQRLIDSAMEEAEEIDNDEDLEEIGSSDFTYYLKNVLDGAGLKVGFVGSRLERLNEDGSIKEINNGFFEDGGFMNGVYADGGFMNDVYVKGGELQGKFLAEIGVPYNYEKVVEDKFGFTEFLSKTLTKKWFGNGVWGVTIVKPLFEKNYGQKIVVEIDIPLGVTQGGGLDKFDVVEFISKTLTKKWFGNGIWSVDVVKSFADGGFMNDVYAKGGSTDSLSVNKASILSATKKCTDGDSDRSTCQSGNFEVTMVYDYGSLDLDFVYLDYNNPRFNPSKEHYASYSFTKGSKGVLTYFDPTVYTKQGRRTDASTIVLKTIEVLKTLGYPVDSMVDRDGEKIEDIKYADGGMFDDNDGFMKADNENNYRYPEREVYVDTIDEPINLTSNVSVRSNEVVLNPISQDINLNEDGKVRAKMTYNPINRTPEKMMAVNQRMIITDLPKPTSNTHKND